MPPSFRPPRRGLNSTGHEIGGTIGIAILSTIAAATGVLAGPQAASGISHAFAAAALLAAGPGVVAQAHHFGPSNHRRESLAPDAFLVARWEDAQRRPAQLGVCQPFEHRVEFNGCVFH